MRQPVPRPEDALAPRAGEATRQALLAAAERMFGEQGIDAVSLLAIARAAGQGNKNAVQYHFGSKGGLIRAILRSRADAIERRRAELTVAAGAEGKLDDVPTLVRAMYLPVIEQVDGEGRFTFARFLLQFMNHPGSQDVLIGPAEIERDNTVTEQIRFLMQRALPHLTLEVVEWRVFMLLRLMLTCLVAHEDAVLRGTATMTRDEVVRQTLSMVTAGLSAPA